MKTNRIAAVQYSLNTLRSEKSFWNGVSRHAAKARADNASLIVFPEYLTAHLLSLSSPMSNMQACEYLHNFTDQYKTRFTELSRLTGLIILGGTHIHREGAAASGAYYNEAFLFFPNGRIESHKKNHLTPEEQRVWPLVPGDRYDVFDTEIGPIGIQVCYDIEFPEGSRILADKGAELILCPSYTDTASGYWRVRHCSQARAVENQLYVALSGLVGSMPEVSQVDEGYCQAGLFAPCDRPFPANGVLAVGQLNKNGLAIADANAAMLAENRLNGGVAPYFDRRPELYREYAETITSSAFAARNK